MLANPGHHQHSVQFGGVQKVKRRTDSSHELGLSEWKWRSNTLKGGEILRYTTTANDTRSLHPLEYLLYLMDS